MEREGAESKGWREECESKRNIEKKKKKKQRYLCWQWKCC